MKLIPNLAEIDRKTVQETGIPAESLMESAGSQVAKAVQSLIGQSGQIIVIVCGPGNNGGDGFVCARHLYQAGFRQVSVIYAARGYQNESLHNFEQLMLLPVEVIDARQQTALALQRIQKADCLVDALFGSGLARPIEGLEAQLVAAMNVRKSESPACLVLAVDIPSGIDGRTGQVLGTSVRADHTVTFACGKPGLYVFPGKAHAGDVQVVDIGIPRRFIDADESRIRLITPNIARHWLPERKPDSHKYSYGHLLVIAGSQAMPGAAILCAEAAMSAGVGLVTLAAPSSVLAQCPLMPEIIRLPLPDQEHLGFASLPILQEALSHGRYSAILLGPGLGQAAETMECLPKLFSQTLSLNLPVVIDADGLNMLSALGCEALASIRSAAWPESNAQAPAWILTPHVGECARLLQMDNPSIQADLLEAVDATSRAWQASVVLKSASTVISVVDDEGDSRLWISPTGNPGMATAGSGDVLAGIIGALTAQRKAQDRSIAMAAPLGVFLHGLAGDLAANVLTPYAMHASEITRFLPDAFKVLLRADENATES